MSATRLELRFAKRRRSHSHGGGFARICPTGAIGHSASQESQDQLAAQLGAMARALLQCEVCCRAMHCTQLPLRL